MKFLSIIVLLVMFVGCSGEDVSRITRKLDDAIVTNQIPTIPVLQPAGFAKLVNSTHSIKDLSFDITGTGGKSPLYHNGSARFSGTITFNQMTSYSNIYQSHQSSCPVANIPVKFECQAKITARIFSQCNIITNAGNYTMRGAFFSAKSSNDRTFDLLNVCVSGPCTGNVPCY